MDKNLIPSFAVKSKWKASLLKIKFEYRIKNSSRNQTGSAEFVPENISQRKLFNVSITEWATRSEGMRLGETYSHG